MRPSCEQAPARHTSTKTPAARGTAPGSGGLHSKPSPAFGWHPACKEDVAATRGQEHNGAGPPEARMVRSRMAHGSPSSSSRSESAECALPRAGSDRLFGASTQGRALVESTRGSSRSQSATGPSGQITEAQTPARETPQQRENCRQNRNRGRKELPHWPGAHHELTASPRRAKSLHHIGAMSYQWAAPWP